MILDTVPVEALERIPDPAPGPDMQVADLLDGQRAATFGLARYAAVLAHLPPAVADALAAEYRHACTLSPDEAERYHPSVAALARTCGASPRALRATINRAIAASRLAGRGVVVNKLLTGTPPRGGSGRCDAPLPRSRRGGAGRVTNADRAAGKRGRGAAVRRAEA